VFDEILVDVLNSFGAATENALVTNNLGHFAKLKLAGGTHCPSNIAKSASSFRDFSCFGSNTI
jgi:hypothetical protein